MFHKGLDKNQIINSAKNLIEEQGFSSFSMRLLAENLGVKTASLYAHIESMDALLTDVGLAALNEQKEYALKQIGAKSGDDALNAYARAYRKFAKEHAELYRFIMKMPVGKDDALKKAAKTVTEPAMLVLDGYDLTDEQKMHWQRILRGLMHGFISQEENGYFSHYPVDVEQSYAVALDCLADGIHREEAKNREQR